MAAIIDTQPEASGSKAASPIVNYRLSPPRAATRPVCRGDVLIMAMDGVGRELS